MAVSKRLRFEILRRDNHTCRYCGGRAPDVTMTVDHVTPKTLGGTDDPANLVAACADCNAGKSSMPPGAPLVADVTADSLRWARAVKELAITRSFDAEARRDLMGWFNMIWCDWTNSRGETFDTPSGAFLQLPTFEAAGLTRDDFSEFVSVTMRSPATDKWAYFCGCCWRRIREIRDQATELVRYMEGQD